MATLAIDAPCRTTEQDTAGLDVAMGSLVVGAAPVADPWSIGHRDQLVIVEAGPGDRVALGELAGAVVRRPSWKHQGVGSMTFEVSTSDPVLLDTLAVQPGQWGYLDTTGELRLLGVEVEWWRDGELRWKGVPVSAEVAGGTMVVSCFDLGWYLTRRFMGTAQRKDLLNYKGQMDRPGLPNWVKTGTCVRNTTTKVRGVGSAQLSGTATMTAAFVHPAHKNAGSLSVYATAMVRVQDDAEVGDVLMTMTTTDPATGDVKLPDPENNQALVTDATNLGDWNRVTCYSLLPPGAPYNVTIRLFNTSGNRYFDDVRVLKNDTTGFPSPGKDLAVHGEALINHANDVSRGKYPTGLWPQRLANTGTVEVMGVRHLEHTQILDIINAYGEREDGWEWRIHPYTKAFQIAPRMGIDHDQEVLHNGSVVSVQWVHDESDRSTAVVILGEGSEIDRPEGGYIKQIIPGSMVLDYLERPPNGTPLAALDPMAKSVWGRVSQPQVTLGRMEVSSDLWPTIGPGDVFPVQVSSGVIRTESTVRISEVVHDLERDVLVLT